MMSKKKKIPYNVVVKTMDTGGAGYNGGIFITIMGSAGTSGELALWKVKWFREDFAEGKSESASLEGSDVGDLYAIKLRIDNPNDQWKPGMVTVTKEEGTIGYFPCYQWITTEITVREAKGTLAFQDNADLLALRQEEIKKWNDLLPWHGWASMPSYPNYPTHDDLPRDLQFESEKRRDMNDYKTEGTYNFLLQKVRGLFDEIKHFFHYTEFFKMGVGDGKVPSVSHRWYTDREFGRQFLQGVHPTAIFRVDKALPSKFPVTDDHVKGSLGRGVTLQQAIDAGHIYMVDCQLLVGIPVSEGRYVTPAMALFYVTASDSLMPIAIQLHQEPGPGNPIWTPDDSHADWLCAKLFLKCADAQIHEIHGHLLHTHLVMEPVMTSLLRNVARCHPLFKLLIPHMRYTIAINTLGRVTLVGAGGFVDKGMAVGGGGHLDLIRLGYRKFDWRLLNVPHALAQRRVDKLPRYYYRDDALKLWNAIEAFVKEVIAVYYGGGDGDVKKDKELQNWIGDLHADGLPQHGLDGEVDHHVPKSVDSVKELIDFLTRIVFCCSAQHAAENFGQFDYYAYNPNAPMIMRRPAPTKKGELTPEKVVESCGTADDASVQIAATWTLAAFSEDEVFLGDYPERHFKEEKTLKAVAGFQAELKRIEAEINERNKKAEVPYIYLKPSRVPNSIAV